MRRPPDKAGTKGREERAGDRGRRSCGSRSCAAVALCFGGTFTGHRAGDILGPEDSLLRPQELIPSWDGPNPGTMAGEGVFEPR